MRTRYCGNMSVCSASRSQTRRQGSLAAVPHRHWVRVHAGSGVWSLHTAGHIGSTPA